MQSRSSTPHNTACPCTRSRRTWWYWPLGSGCSCRGTRGTSRAPRNTEKPGTCDPRTPRSWHLRWVCSPPGSLESCSTGPATRRRSENRGTDVVCYSRAGLCSPVSQPTPPSRVGMVLRPKSTTIVRYRFTNSSSRTITLIGFLTQRREKSGLTIIFVDSLTKDKAPEPHQKSQNVRFCLSRW